MKGGRFLWALLMCFSSHIIFIHCRKSASHKRFVRTHNTSTWPTSPLLPQRQYSCARSLPPLPPADFTTPHPNAGYWRRLRARTLPTRAQRARSSVPPPVARKIRERRDRSTPHSRKPGRGTLVSTQPMRAEALPFRVVEDPSVPRTVVRGLGNGHLRLQVRDLPFVTLDVGLQLALSRRQITERGRTVFSEPLCQ